MVNLFPLTLLLSGIVPLSTATALPACKAPAIRKEWRALGHDGQKAFAEAVKCLSHLPHDPGLTPTGATPGIPPILPNSSRYDDVVYTHIDAVNSAHFTGRFLPWHRLFLHTVEGLLRDKCGYKGYMPYWDWSMDSHDIKNSPIFNGDPDVGLGSFPDSSTNFELHNGAFRDIIRAYPVAHHIQRNYTLRPFENQIFPWVFNLPDKEANSTQTAEEYIKITTSFIGNFTGFQAYMDGFRAEGLHNAAHLSLGGDLANISHSPNDPLFFLLHAQLDRVWAAWQAHNHLNLNAIAGGEDQDLQNFDAHPLGTGTPVTKDTILFLANLGPNAKVSDVFDTTGGYLCYKYAT